MTEDFTKDLNLNVVVTEEQTFESTVLDGKDLKDLLFVDLAYSGVLPKDTKISFYADGLYGSTDKVYLYYYNPETDGIELISDSVEIDNFGYATISLNHASTYFLSKAKIETPEEPVLDNEDLDETPKTGVVSYTAIVAGIVLVSVAGVIALRKRA